MKKVTLSDIAQKTGFSINTVSHALHDKKDISEKTKKLVKDAASKLGYIGNSSASYLRSGRSGNVALIVSDISNPHFSIMIKEMERNLRVLGYSAFVLNTDENEKTEKEAIISALAKNVDGIIICPVQKSVKNMEFLEKAEAPFVLFGRRFKDREWDYVVLDDEHGGYAAAHGLLEMGHRKILFLEGPEYISSASERILGARRAFDELKLENAVLYELTVPATQYCNEKKMVEILEKYPECTAIIAFSDMIALEACHALRLMKKRVPEDVSVLGFDNIASKFFLPLMLSSVSSSKTNMATVAVDILMKKMTESDFKTSKIVLPTKLILRETTTNL